MKLSEFLDQPNIATMSPQEAAIAARAYTVGRIWRINNEERKVQVLTRLIIENTLPRLEAARDSATNPEPLKELARQLREALDLDLLMNDLYFINLGNPEVAAGYAAAVQFGLLTASELAAFQEAATHIETPLVRTTLKDVLLHRGEMTYAQISNESVKGGWLKLDNVTVIEGWNPQVYTMSQGVRRRISGFQVVDGTYLALVNSNRMLEVDNEYGVVV